MASVKFPPLLLICFVLRIGGAFDNPAVLLYFLFGYQESLD